MSFTGLWALDMVMVPRGLSIFADSMAVTISARLARSPFTAWMPTASSCAESYPCMA
jgi:hypothetical protein